MSRKQSPRPELRRRGPWQRWIIRVNCTIIAICGLAIAAMTRTTLQSKSHASSSHVATQNSLPAEIQDCLPVGPHADGFWTVDGADFLFRQLEMTDAELVSKFRIAHSLQAEPSAGAPPVQLPAEWNSLREASHQTAPYRRDGLAYYALDQPDVRAMWIVREAEDHDELIEAIWGTRSGNDRWSVTELKASASSFGAKEDHLLPLPSTATRLLTRTSLRNRMAAELITLRSDASSLVRQWRADGWQVRHSGFANPRTFSYLCVRGSRTVYAWTDESVESITRLMLVDASTSGAGSLVDGGIPHGPLSNQGN